MNLLRVKITGGKADLDLPEDELGALRRMAEKSSRGHLQRLVDLLLDEEEGMRRSPDPKLNLECAAVRMACLEPLVPIDEILEKVETLERRLRQAGSPSRAAPPEKVPEAPEATPPAVPRLREEQVPWGRDAGKEAWDTLKAHVKRVSQPLWCRIEPGELLGFENDTFRNYVFFDDLAADASRRRLEDMGRECLGRKVALSLERLAGNREGKGAPQPEGNGRGRRAQEVQAEALNHPTVQKVMDLFDGAEICEVIPKNGNG